MDNPPVEAVASLPPLYGSWLDALLGGPIPAETNASCQDCAMLAAPGQPPREGFYFNPSTKCCTYTPDLPNFLVGDILADGDPAQEAGRARVESNLRSINCTPRGLHRPAATHLLYEAGADTFFGRARSLRCPYYLEEGGSCGIWRHRNSTCATWFCKYVRGAVGKRFWDAVYALLAAVERHLAGWCVIELNPGPEALRQSFPAHGYVNQAERLDAAHLDDAADPAERRALWGGWWGREREDSLACATRVHALSWDQVGALCGPDVRAFALLALRAYAELLSEEIPDRLQVRSSQMVQLDPQRCRVTAYRSFDPLELPRRLLDALPSFDGRPTQEVLRAVEVEEGLRLNPALVRKLVDFEILVPAEQSGGAR